MAARGTNAGHRATLLSRLVRRRLIALYRWKGWTLEGGHPGVPKFVITGAPHTSNWDFVFFIGATHTLGIRPSFMGKHTLFKWPMTRFMEDMGGISVDRSQRGSNYVEQVAHAFAQADELALVVAPEGTRSTDGEWRSGFWHIARAAGVPIVPAWVDNATMIGGLGEPIWPSDDLAADLARLAEFYRAKLPGCGRFERLAAQAERMGGE
ncbi:lysophospholipid acyltransferase family protein [Tsuneonella sp. YG55]|uniref:Lysophospholipid acyltransferase family protein n=1 Tax=Tsuneonella litorea TaxID=2976475 RepID=A0A9X3AM25_9SPHN|nr:lysophospholipid acyltransferase family protein [Tsuneonella litorea]MCT2559968.1 lysophospholipid acyltransferase family protein [Tsuneonella litorea]